MSTQFKLPFKKNRNAASIEGIPLFNVGRVETGWARGALAKIINLTKDV